MNTKNQILFASTFIMLSVICGKSYAESAPIIFDDIDSDADGYISKE